MAWSREVASELADEGSFARGVAYARDGRVERLETSDRSSTATVRGSRPYRVELSGPARPLAWSCDCPVNDDGRFCKHCVAVALVVAGADTRSLSPLHDDADAVRARPSVRRAAAAGRAIDVRECRARLRKAFGNGRFIDYLAAPAWEAGVDEALSELDDLLDAGYAVEVVDLVEYAHARVEKAMPHVDDSDGCIGRMSIRLAGLHLRACAGAELDPVKLARRLLELELGAELDTFHRAALTYAKVLGPVGIDEYRRKIEPRFDQLALEPGNDWSHDRFRIRNARIGVALAAGDPDELIAVNTPSLRLPDDYVEIAGLLAQAGRDDEARRWCERGLVAFREPAVTTRSTSRASRPAPPRPRRHGRGRRRVLVGI